MNSSMRSESAARADKQLQNTGGLSMGALGAVFGASLGVVLAALLDVSAPLPIDSAVSSSWTVRGWLIGALVGTVSGYVLGALVAWELSDDPVPGSDRRDDDHGLVLGLEARELPEFPEKRSETSCH